MCKMHNLNLKKYMLFVENFVEKLLTFLQIRVKLYLALRELEC